MKITVWGINYHPELIGIGLYSTQMCEFLAGQGHEVTVVTGYPYYPQWRHLSNVTHLFQQDRRNKVLIQRSWHFVPQKPGALKRILHELSFVLITYFRLLTLPRPDVYIVVSPPLLLGTMGWLLSVIRGTKYVFHIQDLQPDAALALGMLKPGIFVSTIRCLEKLAYTGATRVSTISQEMCEIVRKRCNADKVMFFPNWVDKIEDTSGYCWRQSKGISDDIKIIAYSGNLGKKQGLNMIVELAETLKNREKIAFLISGAGPTLEVLESECRSRGLSNVLFQGLLSDVEHTAMLKEIDIFLIPQQAGSGNFLFPSKLLKPLSLGCTVLTNAEPNSALHRVLTENNCGVVVKDTSVQTLADTVLSLLEDGPLRRALGESGKKYAATLERNRVLSAFLQNLEQLVGQ